ncbi:RHS repeat-associated core domain-containing protein [Xanthomonas sacchari]|nr:RHS repeat-associated core domain-containing protein [Xanthomonas sacchari]MDV0437195.1 RHS repeat-associated core domain-containing protein [Xanthomonas sacchari]
MSNFQGIRVAMHLMAAAALSLLIVFGVSAQTVRYIHTDGLGSVVLVTDKDRNVVERREYEPYGSVVNQPVMDGPGYTGHVMDAATGMTYMQQRYYDSVVGRFLSVDPVSVSSAKGSNMNRYWYSNNNPYRFIDPDGRYVCSSGSDSDCKAVKAALRDARSMTQSAIKVGEDKAALNSVLKFLGKDGVDNGVTIKFGDGYGMGNTLSQGGKTTISIDRDGINNLADRRGISRDAALTATLFHEGQHGIDWKRDGMPKTSRQEHAGELRAARTEASAWELMKTDSWWGTWTNLGGYNEDAIKKEADAATSLWCGDSCK